MRTIRNTHGAASESRSAGKRGGDLKKDITTDFHIRAEIPVVAVGGDQQAAAVGLGVVAPGLMCVNTGTGSFIVAHADHPAFDERQRVVCSASAVAGKWLIEAGIFTSGSVYRWFRDNFATIESKTQDAKDCILTLMIFSTANSKTQAPVLADS